jgi:translocator protein
LEAKLDASAKDHWSDLADSLSDHAINFVANLIFTPIQFGLRNLPLAAVDILIVWGTIIWMMVVIWMHHKWVTVAQVPYFVWVSTATILQLSMTWMNWGS